MTNYEIKIINCVCIFIYKYVQFGVSVNCSYVWFLLVVLFSLCFSGSHDVSTRLQDNLETRFDLFGP